ncbi:MAG: flagellar biosynthesis protein FlhB [Candidatus Thiodiazotropha lotti]|uniref:Flagellar biosynthetic protein FlhB n=1 Tax=Candidatus Thiodiazotropha lotti TaxID=2792787 RepID=A0A9E4K4Z8_9GAMM|nr:flagellar type III secretion system protein FlhB [Candidatus Thiodiazotropha lotti]ODB99694.1 flagellar biosynthesis protein FlhB [Candidatus Thiodiazotropha endoloripes]MCG7923716.1 flagellar type III secretion system protein FlhB [Candidatus Thiodiazotropha lotti]MCG7932453.1 flagellar type III secretion system protein FlhB [Candidatus Thiodiazotropha lotti]MCG7939550.1 flagellar type III secretion system protein FlhB [Candidatus Thiodiazotropha lotti]
MAENENGQEKTEQPSAKKLTDAKRKGQVPRSRELNSMAVTMAGVISLVVMSGSVGDSVSEMMSQSFVITREQMFDIGSMTTRLGEGIGQAFFALIPFFLMVILAAILSSVALGGFSISGESMTPKLSKLSPLKGLKRVFSAKGLVEMFKAMAKFVLIGGTTVFLLYTSLGQFLALHNMEISPALQHLNSLIGWSVILMSTTMILIAAIDVPFQLWDHKRQLKMTRQEVRDEMKETEGRPEVKGRIRQLQREMAQRRMMQEVPKADVIVTNPTHYAVALKYDPETMHAPKLVAKGVDLIAQNIRKVGGEANVPVVESPLLARAIYFHTELDTFIPAGLYMAVARLLAYVFQLKAYSTEGGIYPEMPDDIDVPEEYRHSE